MTKTAVEWYHSKVIELMRHREQGNIDVLEFRNQLDLLLDQAKAMEKEQIIQARTTAPIIPTIDMIDYVKESEQYYNETFK